MNPRAIVDFFSGKKSYLVGVSMIIYAFGINQKWWPNDPQIWGILGGTGVMTLRAAVAKLLKQFLDDFTAASATPPAAAITATEVKK